MHTPRFTLASWAGQAGAALEPLYEEHKRFVLASRVLHADETPVALLDPGAGKLASPTGMGVRLANRAEARLRDRPTLH